MSSLPQSILDLVEMDPVEDFVLGLLRAKLPDVSVNSLIADDQAAPLVLVRRSPESASWRGSHRFVNACYVDINVFCDGIDADADCARLSEAIRVVLRDAWLDNYVVPDMGHLKEVTMTISPNKRPDWATATGPVQYADLPAGWVRYESTFFLAIRTAR